MAAYLKGLGRLSLAIIAVGFSITITTAGAQEDQIQIAWAGPLTGDVALLGRGVLNGVELAVEEWNTKGGVLGRKLVIAPEDDACEPKQASTVATKIADDPKTVVMVGHFCSGTTLAGGPIINKANLPMISFSSNPKVTQQGWKNHVRVVASDTIQGAAIVGFATKKLGAKTFAILHDNQAMGQGVGQVAREKIEQQGGTVTSFGGIDPKDFDYSAVLTKIIKTEKPDAILYCTNFPTSAGLVVKQSRQLGFDKIILGCDGFLDPSMIKAAGASAEKGSANSVLYFSFQAPPYSGSEATEAVKAFAKKYKDKFGNDPNGWELYGYDAANIAINAIAKAQSVDKQKIIDVLHSQKVPGVLVAEYQFSETGDVVQAPMFIYTVDQGKFVMVEQVAD